MECYCLDRKPNVWAENTRVKHTQFHVVKHFYTRVYMLSRHKYGMYAISYSQLDWFGNCWAFEQGKNVDNTVKLESGLKKKEKLEE